MSDLTKTEKKVLTYLYHASKRNEAGQVDDIAKGIGESEADVLKALNRLFVLGMVGKPDFAAFGLDAVDKALRDLDEKADCDTAARVLMASVMIGAGDEESICRMGLDPDEVRKIGDRFRANGIWDAGGIAEPADGTEFWMMVLIGQGRVRREYDHDKGEWMYSVAHEGKARVETLLGK